MTISEFNKLSFSRRSDINWEWGFLITNHKSGDYNTIVFSLENFYVETKIFIPENRTVSITAIKKKQMNPGCLQQIRKGNPVFNRVFGRLKKSQILVAA